MKIEAGKFYRMRCGGAVKITKKEICDTVVCQDTHFEWEWNSDGTYEAFGVRETMLDLVAEISEQEYNRIVSGEESDAILDMAQNAVMQSHYEVEELKRHNANLHRNLEAWESDYATLKEECERIKREYTNYIRTSSSLDSNIREERRFEAAKAFMQGILSKNDWAIDTHHVYTAVGIADALLKALEETK